MTATNMDSVAALARYDNDGWYSEWWKERLSKIYEEFTEFIPEDFFRYPSVAGCGVETNDADAALREFEELVEVFGDAETVLRLCESDAGPRTDDSLRNTSIHHLYSLHRAGWPKGSDGVILEWGGGFGNMARLTRNFDPAPKHIVVDSPTMLCLQRRFLGSYDISGSIWSPFLRGIVWGESNVLLVPHGAVKQVTSMIHVDTFVGTWSVDESSAACQEFLFDNDWFGASTVLLAMEPNKDLFPDSGGVHRRCLDAGFIESPTIVPGSVYLRLDR